MKNEVLSDKEKEKELIKARNKASIGNKIREYRLQKGIAAQDLSEMLGQARSAVTNWEGGFSRPDLFVIPKLCEVLGMSVEELLDCPVKEGQYSKKDTTFFELYSSLSTNNKSVLRKLAGYLKDEEEASAEEALLQRCKWLPESDLKACAGGGNYLDHSHDVQYNYLYNCYAVGMADEIITVMGNSMEPTFYDGDKLLVQHTGNIRPGEVGVFIWNGEGLVKEYQKDGLYPHNKAYSVIHPDENDDLRCIGRVMGAVTPDMQVTKMERYILEKARMRAM